MINQFRNNKIKNIRESGQAALNNEKWKYEEAMQFLDPFLHNKSTVGINGSSIQVPAAMNPSELIFQAMMEKIKDFSPYYRNLAKTKILTLIEKIELEMLQNQE